MPEAFRDPEQFMAACFNSAAVGLAIVDPQLRFVAVNEALAEMNGIPVKHHFGKTVRQILGNASGQIEPFFKQVLSTNEATPNVEITALLPTRRDAGRWLETFFPIKNRAGELRHIAAVDVEVPPTLSTSQDLSLSSSATISNFGDLLVKGESAATSAKPGIQLGSAILGGLAPETQEWMWKAAAVRQCSRGEFFCLQGQQADKLFLLKRGCVKL